MPEDFEGALNDGADVSPTDSGISGSVEPTPEGETDPYETAHDARDDADADGNAERSLNEASDGEGSERGPIPYERFKEVNEKAHQYEQQARLLQEHQAVLQQAVSAGFPTVEAYHSANMWAQANNFPSIEAYQAALAEQRQLEAYAVSLSQRPDLTDPARQELFAARQQQVAINNQMQAIQQQVQFVQHQNLSHAIDTAKAELGPLDPELEHLFRYSTPQVVQQATAALKRQLHQATQNRVAEYAATKQRTQSSAAPEGKGGNPPGPSGGSRGGWKKSSFADLIFGHGRTG